MALVVGGFNGEVDRGDTLPAREHNFAQIMAMNVRVPRRFLAPLDGTRVGIDAGHRSVHPHFVHSCSAGMVARQVYPGFDAAVAGECEHLIGAGTGTELDERQHLNVLVSNL